MAHARHAGHSRAGRRVGRLLAVALLAWLAVSWWASGRLLTPHRAAVPTPPAVEGLAREDLTLHTQDGVDVAAWIVTPAGTPRGVCLLLHPLGGSRSWPRATFAARRGLAVVALDLRGHGASGGDRTGFGWAERAEVRAAVSEIRRRWPESPLVGWGTSLGAAALVLALDPAHADALPPATFDALILESLYADIDTAFTNRVDAALGPWARPLLWPTRRLVGWRSGLREQRLDPEAALVRLTAIDDVSLLLATGARDVLSTPEELARLAVASGGEAVLVEHAPHADLFGHDGGAWLERVRALLDGVGAVSR